MTEEPFFLTDQDIADLTGYVRADKQREHLRLLGIPFFPDRNGRPRVAREAFRNKLRLISAPPGTRFQSGDVEIRIPYDLPPRPKTKD